MFTAHCSILCGFERNVGKLQHWNGLGEVSRWNTGGGVGGVLRQKYVYKCWYMLQKNYHCWSKGKILEIWVTLTKVNNKAKQEGRSRGHRTSWRNADVAIRHCALESCRNIRSERLKRRRLLENLRVGGRIILKWNLNRMEGCGPDTNQWQAVVNVLMKKMLGNLLGSWATFWLILGIILHEGSHLFFRQLLKLIG